jgi:AmpE protein
MSAALIAVVVALLLGHRLPEPGALRQFGWFDRWRSACDGRLGAPAAASTGGVLLLLLPVFALAVVQVLLAERLFGLPGFMLAVVVVFLCWGPRDLDRDVEAVLDADSSDQQLRAAQWLYPHGAASTADRDLVDAAFSEALRRWFGVLFWFLLLGPSGALLFRLTQLIVVAHRPAQVSSLATLRLVMEWPVAQLMTLALALAASFDAVFVAWRDWHQQRGEGWFAADIGFLHAAGRASVVFELAEESTPADADTAPGLASGDHAEDPSPSAVGDAEATCSSPALRDAMSLVWRILIVWLTVVALLVLAGYVG